jgi:NAD(P)-dependent dehydrogenase (short-subunit alcohol dehydrogenase family)
MPLADLYRLEGRTAIVTGASRGIGRGIATVFAEAGANVVLAARGVDNLREVKAHIDAAGGRALVVPTDVGIDADLEQLVETTKSEFGAVDVVVNNAAAQRWALTGQAHEMPVENLDATMHINLHAPFLLSQLAAQDMIERKSSGVIVNITSIAGWMGIAGLGSYSASKAALMRWSEATAAEWGPLGIRVNCVGPGFIKTDETRGVWDDPAALKRVVSTTPVGRIGDPEEIGHAALFLASDAAAYITGQTLYVDGGWGPVRPMTGYADSSD